MCEMGYQQMQATVIGEYNQSCVKLATNPVMHKRFTHIDRKYHFIGKEVDDNSVQLVYTPTNKLPADLLTKSLPYMKVEQHRKQLLGQLQFLPHNNGTI